MNALALVALLGAQSVEPSEFKFNVEVRGSEAGSAVMTIRDLADQRRQVVMTMTLRVGGPTALVRQETIYDANGAASRKILETSVNGAQRQRVIAELTDAGASLTETLEGKTTTSQIPLAKDAPRSNAATFWFVRSRPRPQERQSYYTFDLGTKTWNLETTQFMGTREITLAGQKRKVNEISILRAGERTTALLDDAGVPWQLELPGQFRIVRRP